MRTAEKQPERLPILSESALSRLQSAEIAADAKLREAYLYLEQVEAARVLLVSLEFSLGASAKRLEIEKERGSFLRKASRGARQAAGTLMEAYATEYWEAVEKDSDKFVEMLPAIRETVERTVACPELTKCISAEINLKTSSWTERVSREDPRIARQAPEPAPPLPAYWEKPTPLFYFETWALKAIEQRDQNQIRAELLSIHAAVLERKMGDYPEIECWRRAYDVFAGPFYRLRLLTEAMLTETILAMVLDAGASGRWMWGRASLESPIGEFTHKFGNEFYTEFHIRRYFFPCIEGRINDWRGKLILQGGSAIPGTDEKRSIALAGADAQSRWDQGGKTPESQFSSQHKAQFQELLAIGELFAVNRNDDNLDFGPWSVSGDHGDSDTISRLRARFRAAARKAAIAAGAPHRVNLQDWWVSKLARGKKRAYIQGLIQRSVEYCEELESNDLELKPLIQEPKGVPGLRRDRYPSDFPVAYLLYTEPHRPLPDATEEFEHWDKYIWQGFASTIDTVARERRMNRRWVDENGNKHAQTNEDARRRIKERVDFRTRLLDACIQSFSYDVAVLQANYIIDRGLRAEAAMRMFQDESAALIEKVRLSWRENSKRLGLSWKKQEQKGVDLAKPFREVGDDLRHLASAIPMKAGTIPPGLENTQETEFRDLVGPAAITDRDADLKAYRRVDSEAPEIAHAKAGPDQSASAKRRRPDLRPTLASTQTRVPLNAELKEAESRTADPKLRNRLVAVLRYNRFFEDLKVLKSACQRYQTPALLAQNFQNLDVWAVMNDDDKADIAKGDFQPGIFAWSLVKRMIGLTGHHNRTLKNYRSALRAAGLQ